jgi:hypothetical protein
MQTAATHSYRATYIPESVSPEDAEQKANAGALPTIQLKAASSDIAAAHAHRLTSRPILRVERIEVGA